MADELEGTDYEGYDSDESGEEPFWDGGELDMAEDGIGATCDTLADFLDSASVDRVFAEPVIQGDTLVIPAAEVAACLGFGVGSGHGPALATSERSPRAEQAGAPSLPPVSGGGSGGGGGGRTFSRPVALVVLGPDGVSVRPIVDPTKIVLAALATAGFIMAMLAVILAPRPRP